MTIAHPAAPAAAVTQQLAGCTAGQRHHPALIFGTTWPGQVISYASLAGTLQGAASGLAWHGLRSADVVGVHVPDAASFALAVHAIRAAGGVPSPIAAGSTVAGMAAQLADCGARMLLTASPLAVAALAAADRSWVRQVISFDQVPGAIAFDSLLCRGTQPCAQASPHDMALLAYARGADGRPSPVAFTYAELGAELARLTGAARLTDRDVVIAVPPTGDGRAYSALIDLVLTRGATLVAPARPAEPDPGNQATAAIVPWGTSLALRDLPVTG